MSSFISSLYTLAVSIGGFGLLGVAFIDSSFVSLPQINDVLVVVMITHNEALMLYYVTMATLGSVGGCYVIYYMANRGGEAFLQRRVKAARMTRVIGLYERHGAMALVVAGLLPPPAPFKLFVLLAGVAGVRRRQFITSVFVARGIRYLALGVLAIAYGDAAMELMRNYGREVALGLVGVLLVGWGGLWFWRRSKIEKK